MNAKQNNPKTLVEAIRFFSDLDNAHAYFVKARWSDGVVCCPHCGSVEVKYLANYRRWECKEKHPKRQFTVKVGTIMEDSPLGLDKWAVGFWLEANAKNSISSYEVHRSIGITQKSAWFMLHRIRHALNTGTFDMPKCGIVEADETFVGGLAKNMHKSRRRKVITGTGGDNKTAVMGLLARHDGKKCSQVHARVIPNTEANTLHEVIRSKVEPGATVYTDAWQAYRTLGPEYFHDFVNHAETYVKGAVHTNGMENFWSLFKRCVKGTHVSIEPFHLNRYIDSEAFRFNNRDTNDGERFALAIKGIHGKRLTYKDLTGGSEFLPPSPDNGEANGGLPN